MEYVALHTLSSKLIKNFLRDLAVIAIITYQIETKENQILKQAYS